MLWTVEEQGNLNLCGAQIDQAGRDLGCGHAALLPQAGLPTRGALHGQAAAAAPATTKREPVIQSMRCVYASLLWTPGEKNLYTTVRIACTNMLLLWPICKHE